MFNIGYSEMMLVLGLALIVFGPKKLPQIGRTVGQTLREFKRASNEIMSTIRDSLKDDDPVRGDQKEGEL